MERRLLIPDVSAGGLPAEGTAPGLPAVTYAVGDIHGRSDLLAALMRQVAKHRAGVAGKAGIVFLGDYVNKGPDSRGVIEALRGLAGFDQVVCLAGNQDVLFREALKSDAKMLEWLKDGGRETLESYRSGPASAPARIPAEHLHFLNGLRNYHDDGVRLFVHAGLKPGLALAKATSRDLLWHRGKSADVRGRLVVHGHSPVFLPLLDEDEVNIDTQAWQTGRLTCAVFRGFSRKPTFLSTAGDPEEAARQAKALTSAPRRK